MQRIVFRSQARKEYPNLQALLAVLALVAAWVVMAALVGLMAGCGLAQSGSAVNRTDPVQTFQRGLSAVDDQHLSEAVQAFRRVAEGGFCDPGWNNAGVVYARQGHTAAALVAYGRAVAECPSQVVYYNRGSLYLRLLRLAEAVRDLRRAVALGPDMPEAWNNLGLALLAQGRHKEALVAMQSAVRLRPSLGRPWNNLGAVFARMGETTEARVAYQRALNLEPGYVKARRNLERLNRQSPQLSSRY